MTGNLILLGTNYRVTEQEHTIQVWNNQNCDETGGQRLQAFDSSTQNLPRENVQKFGSPQCHYMEVLLYLHENTPGYTYFSLVHENSLTVITEIINSRWGYCIVIWLFPYQQTSQPSWPIQPPIQWVLGVLSPGVSMAGA
jgi:hypothetical protein